MRRNDGSSLWSDRLEATLRSEVDVALKAHRLAQDAFWRVCSTEDRGMPREVRAARVKQDTSRQALAVALIRLNDYKHYGVIPEDLRYLNEVHVHATGTL